MFLTLTVLAALIGIMFVASVASSLSEMYRENEEARPASRRRVF